MGNEAKLDITKILANSTAKFFASEAGKALIQAELAKLFEDVGFEGLQYLTNEEATEKTPTESKSKASKPPKVDFKGQDKLIEDLHEHYDDFDSSELAEASRELNEGRCGLYSLVLTWASMNKCPEATKWAKAKGGNSKALRPWWKPIRDRYLRS